MAQKRTRNEMLGIAPDIDEGKETDKEAPPTKKQKVTDTEVKEDPAEKVTFIIRMKKEEVAHSFIDPGQIYRSATNETKDILKVYAKESVKAIIICSSINETHIVGLATIGMNPQNSNVLCQYDIIQPCDIGYMEHQKAHHCDHNPRIQGSI
eukprot:8503_1